MRDKLRGLGLTRAETDVVMLIAQSLKNLEIADKLFVSEGAIKFHITNIYKKLKPYGVKDREGLIRFYRVTEIVKDQEGKSNVA